MTDWQPWGECECGKCKEDGLRERKEFIRKAPKCDGKACGSLDKQQDKCKCPGNEKKNGCCEDCESEWGPWGSCDKTCKQQRTKKIKKQANHLSSV